MKCSFCGREIDNTTNSAVSVAGKEYHLCAPCQSAASKAESVFEARRREGEAYFGTILDTVELSPDAAAVVNYLAGSPMKQADIEKKMLSRDNGLDRQEEKQQQAEQAIRDGLAGKEETEEQEEQEEQNEPEADEEKKEEDRPNGTGFFILFFVFMALAVFFYCISVANDYNVANIQTTVFAAASFVAGIVCLAAGRIIRAVNMK